MVKVFIPEFRITRQPDGEAITPGKAGMPIPASPRFSAH